MKKVLLIGVNDKIESTKILLAELEKNNIKADFIRYGNLIFSGSKIEI